VKFRHRSSNDIIACSFLARNHPLRWFQFRHSSNDRLNNTCEVSYDRHSAAYHNEIKVLYHYIKPVRLNENLLESVIGFFKCCLISCVLPNCRTKMVMTLKRRMMGKRKMTMMKKKMMTQANDFLYFFRLLVSAFFFGQHLV